MGNPIKITLYFNNSSQQTENNGAYDCLVRGLKFFTESWNRWLPVLKRLLWALSWSIDSLQQIRIFVVINPRIMGWDIFWVLSPFIMLNVIRSVAIATRWARGGWRVQCVVCCTRRPVYIEGCTIERKRPAICPKFSSVVAVPAPCTKENVAER